MTGLLMAVISGACAAVNVPFMLDGSRWALAAFALCCVITGGNITLGLMMLDIL